MSEAHSSRIQRSTGDNHSELRRKSRKHLDFQHDGHIDFKFIENVNADKKSLKNGVHYIKNPTSSGGDSDHIDGEIIHLQHLGEDGKSVRNFFDRK